MSSLSVSSRADRAETPRRARGFALFSRERLRQVSSDGGKRAHELGLAHEFTPEEARIAGSKGGKAAAARRAKVRS